jgi:hypothetical protein
MASNRAQVETFHQHEAQNVPWAADIPENGTSHASRGKRKEVKSMKFSRKMQLQLDSKIRHAMATSQLLVGKRSSATETHPRPEMDKADGNGAGHSK